MELWVWLGLVSGVVGGWLVKGQEFRRLVGYGWLWLVAGRGSKRQG